MNKQTKQTKKQNSMSKVSFVKEGAPSDHGPVGVAGLPGDPGCDGAPRPVEVVGHSEGIAYPGVGVGRSVVAPVIDIPCTAVTTTAPLPVTLAPPRPPTYNDEDISFDDIIVPRINIVQKVGDLSNVFETGEIVLNQSLVIHTPASKEKNREGTGSLLIIPLGFKKPAYVEKVPGGGKGAYCETREGVVALNGTLDYREWKSSNGGKKRFETLATCLFLIRRPEFLADVDHQTFNHEVEGVFYALAQWSMKGTAYTNAAKRFFTERKIGFLKRPPTGSIDRGYPSFGWSLTTRLESFNGDAGEKNYAVIPVLTPGPKSSDAILAYVKDGIGLR